MSVQIERVSSKLDLGEGPHWDAKSGKLYFVDIHGSSIHQYDPKTNKHTSAIVDGNKKVSLIIPIENEVNKFVITLDCDFATVTWDGVSETVLDVQVFGATDNRFKDLRINDGKCSPSGVLFAGTMVMHYQQENVQANGHLYAVKGNTMKTLLDGVILSNGLAWSKDEKTFYYIDSGLFRIDAFDYNPKNITLSNFLYAHVYANRRTIFDMKANNINGFPDGMAIDTDGNLWMANFGGSKVLKINPSTGTILGTITFPAKYITSVAFGGPSLQDLYVTSACKESGSFFDDAPDAGVLFKVPGIGSQGLPGVAVKL